MVARRWGKQAGRGGLVLALGVALVLGPAVGAGCNKPRRRVLTKEQRDLIQRSILQAPPAKMTKEVNASFDGKIRLLGVDLSQDTVKAGESFEVSYYWKVDELPPKGGWKVFVHFEAPGRKRTTHDHQPVGELYPISKWKKGEIVKDTQRIPVAKDFPSGTARLYVGIYDAEAWSQRKQNVRMAVTNKDIKTRADKDSRVLAATVKVTGGKPAAKGKGAKVRPDRSPRRYTAHKATGPITLDGKLDEPAWRMARPTRPFVTPGGERLSPSALTQARLTWDDENLYVAFKTRDGDIWSDLKGRDATLWKQDVVEIYLDPGADGKDYLELQVSPTGEIFDALFTSRRKPDWPEAAKNLTLAGMRVAVDAQGSVNRRDDGQRDQGWTVEVAIPFADIPGVGKPPADKTAWAMNLYRIDVNKGRRGTMGAWAPAGGDFHNTAGFGRLLFSTAPPARPVGPGRRPALRPGLRPGTGPARSLKPAAPKLAPAKPAGTKPAGTKTPAPKPATGK